MKKSKSTASAARWCYFIPAGQYDEHGYIPSLVTEYEAGHSPMTGDASQTPWYWGKTYERAQQVCDRFNLDRLGLTKQTAARIVASSMAAGSV